MKIQRRPHSIWMVIGLCGMVSLSGCSRPFWRKQADRDSYEILAEKMTDDRWNLPRLNVEPDPTSRFYDPYDPDQEPLPPDDPAAHQYMHQMGYLKGYKSWHEMGDAFSIENPNWLVPFGLTPEDIQQAEHTNYEEAVPSIEKLSLTQAIELSNIHSRQYQTQIEDLYLSALGLTLDRFQFDVRYLSSAGRPTSRSTLETIPGGTSSLRSTNRFGVSQLLPTGAQWIVELTNNTLWVFSGSNSTSTASVLSYSLVQPLMLGAGRKIVLEALTQQEREVLYSARDLARFRKGFFTDTVSGGRSSGYLGLLQQRQQVLNEQGNIIRLEEQVQLLRALASQMPEEISEKLVALPDGLQIPQTLQGHLRYDADNQLLIWIGSMSAEHEQSLLGLSNDVAYLAAVNELIQRLRTDTVNLDVAQLESRLASSRNNFRSLERSFQDRLDQFKIQLGLPPDMRVTIDESLLNQFQLIDPSLISLEEALKDFVEIWAQLDEDNVNFPALRKVVDGLNLLQQRVRDEGLELLQHDFNQIDEKLVQKPPQHQTEEDRLRVANDLERDRRQFLNVLKDFGDVQESLKQLSEIVSQENPTNEQKRDSVRKLDDLRQQMIKGIQGIQVIQVGLRVELISLAEFTMSLPDSTAYGMDNRLDLMNQKSFVMDARRDMEIKANQLESVLDIVVEGDIGTPTDSKPFNFQGSSSSFRTGLRFTAPVNQIRERNQYRASQIAYQRSRRDFMASEDEVKLQIRLSWRNLNVLKRNFEIQRQAVRIAALQLDLAVEESNAPRAPGQRSQSGSQGLNLLNAFRSVLNAQNALIAIWVSYERSRLNIHRDMGMMEIDAQGIWRDPYYKTLLQQPPSEDEPAELGLRRTGKRNYVTSSRTPTDVPAEDRGRLFGQSPGVDTASAFQLPQKIARREGHLRHDHIRRNRRVKRSGDPTIARRE